MAMGAHIRSLAGNDHAGTLYPAAVYVTRVLLCIIGRSTGASRGVATNLLLDWWGVFSPESGYEVFNALDGQRVGLIKSLVDTVLDGREALIRVATEDPSVATAELLTCAEAGWVTEGMIFPGADDTTYSDDTIPGLSWPDKITQEWRNIPGPRSYSADLVESAFVRFSNAKGGCVVQLQGDVVSALGASQSKMLFPAALTGTAKLLEVIRSSPNALCVAAVSILLSWWGKWEAAEGYEVFLDSRGRRVGLLSAINATVYDQHEMLADVAVRVPESGAGDLLQCASLGWIRQSALHH